MSGMKNRRVNGLKLFALPFMTAFLLFINASCERRPLVSEGMSFYELTINVDWSRFIAAGNSLPHGMSVLCFNRANPNEKPHVYRTNNVTSQKLVLNEGEYDILVFNRTPIEFGSLDFFGQDKFETFEISLGEASSSSWYRIPENKSDMQIVVEPEKIGVAVYSNFIVTRTMIDELVILKSKANRKKAKAKPSIEEQNLVQTITVRPENIAPDVHVRINVEGLHNILGVRATIGGMAKNYMPAYGRTGDLKAIHLLNAENWRAEELPGDRTKGCILTEFSSFGLPHGKETLEPEGIILDLTAMLVDKDRTIVNYSLPVGDKFRKVVDKNGVCLYLELNVEVPIVIPDVTPGETEGGFDIDVTDWGKMIFIDAPMS